jgi:nitrite reductase/ring-hydroxylating ferredoxin subunit
MSIKPLDDSPTQRDEDGACGCLVTRRDFLAVGSCTMSALLAHAAISEASGLALAGGEERSYPIPQRDGVTIDRAAQVILVRQQARLYAFNLSCPHQNAAVRWVEKSARFQCSRHDSRYAPDGTHTAGRATRNMDRFGLRRDGATVIVDVSRIIRSDQDPAGWAAASVSVE